MSPIASLARQRRLILDYAADTEWRRPRAASVSPAPGSTSSAAATSATAKWGCGRGPSPSGETRDGCRSRSRTRSSATRSRIPPTGRAGSLTTCASSATASSASATARSRRCSAGFGLEQRSTRLAAAELRGLEEGGPITERALGELRARERRETLRVGSDEPGEELFLETMYVGKLKDVGPVWQFASVVGACSFRSRRRSPARSDKSRRSPSSRERVLPVYEEAGISIGQITTDRGPEFGRGFREALRLRGIRHRRLPPRSPNLNGFVQRLDGTILHEHYRIAFRLRYHLAAEDVDADLQCLLRHYNFERPHRGRRLQGATPASRFYAGRPELLSSKGW